MSLICKSIPAIISLSARRPRPSAAWSDVRGPHA